MSFKKIVIQGYNKIALRYLKDRGRFVNDSEIREFAEHLKPGSRVLDAGCGTGIPFAKYLADLGHNLLGIDISEKMLSLARGNVPQGKFLQMDISKLTFEDSSFDGVVCAYAMFHLPREKHDHIILEFNRILKPGGILLFSTGTDDWEGIEDFYGTDMYWSYYAPSRYRDLLKLDFDIIFEREIETGNETHFWFCARKRES